MTFAWTIFKNSVLCSSVFTNNTESALQRTTDQYRIWKQFILRNIRNLPIHSEGKMKSYIMFKRAVHTVNTLVSRGKYFNHAAFVGADKTLNKRFWEELIIYFPWVGPMVDLDALAKRRYLPLPRIEPRSSSPLHNHLSYPSDMFLGTIPSFFLDISSSSTIMD